MTRSGMHGAINYVLAIYLLDSTLATAFAAAGVGYRPDAAMASSGRATLPQRARTAARLHRMPRRPLPRPPHSRRVTPPMDVFIPRCLDDPCQFILSKKVPTLLRKAGLSCSTSEEAYLITTLPSSACPLRIRLRSPDGPNRSRRLEARARIDFATAEGEIR